MSNWRFISSSLLSWWIFQVAFWLVLVLLVLLVQWLTTKASNRWCFLQKPLLNCYGKAKLGKSEQRAAQASSVSSGCQPFYSAVEERAETEPWLKALSHHRIRMHPVFAVCTPILNSNKVINAVISSNRFTIEKPKWSPQGHLCLSSSCPCLPSFTSGSFHWEKDAGWGAALQIPPGCGICNKQPRGMSDALSLPTPGLISSSNNLQFVSWFVSSK